MGKAVPWTLLLALIEPSYPTSFRAHLPAVTSTIRADGPSSTEIVIQKLYSPLNSAGLPAVVSSMALPSVLDTGDLSIDQRIPSPAALLATRRAESRNRSLGRAFEKPMTMFEEHGFRPQIVQGRRTG